MIGVIRPSKIQTIEALAHPSLRAIAEDAKAKMTAIKKGKMGAGKKDMDYKAIGEKLKAAVKAGKLTEEEAKAKTLYESEVPLDDIVAKLGRQRTAILNKASKEGWHRPPSAKWRKAEVTWTADNLKVLQAESSGHWLHP